MENNLQTTYSKKDIDKNTSGNQGSYWINSTKPIMFMPLNRDLEVDTVIVGGGIAGLTVAYSLSKRGKRIALVEDGFIGSGETGRTTAHIVNALDDRYYDLESFFDQEGAKLAAESHTAAIEFIEKIVREEQIDCDFERLDGYLFLDPTDEKVSLERELEATHKAGINTELLQGVPGIPTESGPCLKFPNQAQFHPLKYLKGLCDAISKYNGQIFTETHAEKIDNEGIISNSGFRIKARHIVVATNTPVNNTVAIHTKQAPYRTYVIGAKIPKNSIFKALWWDTGNQESKWPTYPYHYVRIHSFDDTCDLLICGGEDHKTGQEDKELTDRFKLLKDWCQKRFPMLGEIVYKWSGQVMEPVDSLAYIGRNPMDAENVFIITGDSGNGMTHGTIAGILIPDLIEGKENKWSKIYDPSRITLKTTTTFIEENANVAEQYADYLTGGDIPEVNQLELGKGAVLRNGLSKMAVYKDPEGNVHAFSAVCPHLNCILHWNESEKTFDCPCHGSRFSCYGKVMNGPANSDLKPVKIATAQAAEKVNSGG